MVMAPQGGQIVVGAPSGLTVRGDSTAKARNLRFGQPRNGDTFNASNVGELRSRVVLQNERSNREVATYQIIVDGSNSRNIFP